MYNLQHKTVVKRLSIEYTFYREKMEKQKIHKQRNTWKLRDEKEELSNVNGKRKTFFFSIVVEVLHCAFYISCKKNG